MTLSHCEAVGAPVRSVMDVIVVPFSNLLAVTTDDREEGLGKHAEVEEAGSAFVGHTTSVPHLLRSSRKIRLSQCSSREVA